ncbi:MAG: diadenylate cyclase CdaA [Phycisphaerae bacterium]|nr:diadenylate cyclase CdaA [Phycisphaerae bacterium]MDD5380508.1 diadenylate cyclase CdaA [Phycisphaerae bacterium]
MRTLIDYFVRVGNYDWWVIVIELFLIGLVVYWAVNFLEGTRGEKLFHGVILILIAGFLILKLVVGRFAFERLQYLYSGFLIAVLIIAVAAFQPEIRGALIRIGRTGFLTHSSRLLSRTAEEIITAVTGLAATKTGAIIVIERKVALGEFIETGIEIDARVSSELLKTIFYPGTPLHDMAVIIRGDRAVSAGVQLPLAEAGSMNGVELGSRHRAAIGITTGSDAICIVISEETGTISIARNRLLSREISEAELRKLLISTMVEMAPVVDRFWRLPRRNNNRKQENVV